jgi:hypothetical protein
MLNDLLDFLVRNQSFSFAIFGLVVSIGLYTVIAPRVVRLIKIVRDLPDNIFLGPPNSFVLAYPISLPLKYIKYIIIAVLSFVFGVIFLPLAAGVYATISDQKLVNDTALLDPPQLIGQPHPDAHIAVIMFHGWTGDPQNTWDFFSKLVASDDDLLDVDVWLANYPTYISRRHLSVSEVSGWIYTDFITTKILPKYTQVYFIGHSLGGVIARDIELQITLDRQTSPVEMIISIGSPFSGAPLSPIASAIGIRADYLTEMAPSSSYLASLSTYWERLHTKPFSFCIWSPVDGIVEKDSATSQCDCRAPYPQWTHIELEKPVSREDLRYRTPIRALLRNLRQVDPDPAVRRRCD